MIRRRRVHDDFKIGASTAHNTSHLGVWQRLQLWQELHKQGLRSLPTHTTSRVATQESRMMKIPTACISFRAKGYTRLALRHNCKSLEKHTFSDAESPGPPDSPFVNLHRHSRAIFVKETPVSPVHEYSTNRPVSHANRWTQRTMLALCGFSTRP